MYSQPGKRELESILRSLGYGDGDFSITCLGGDISSIDRIELQIREQTFDGTFNEIHQALTQSETPRQLVQQLSSRGLSRRGTDDG